MEYKRNNESFEEKLIHAETQIAFQLGAKAFVRKKRGIIT